jgi:hypothetical protein
MVWVEFENHNPGPGKRRIKGTHLIPQRNGVTRGNEHKSKAMEIFAVPENGSNIIELTA